MNTQGKTEMIEALGPWFHNIHLPDGQQTAPEHFLGDFPSYKWEAISANIPQDLTGWKVLDIGCNAGYYSVELAKRGADVLAIDLDPHYLKQAKWVAEQFGLSEKITFKEMQVYDLAGLEMEFDLIWFMGVFYHLRYPLLALDIVTRKTKNMMVFQTLSMPGGTAEPAPDDIPINKRDIFLKDNWPKMAFIEKKLSNDPTNWWAPNSACIEAMLRSCGMVVQERPEDEIFICKKSKTEDGLEENWNESEYLSAIGKQWKTEAEKKVKEKIIVKLS